MLWQVLCRDSDRGLTGNSPKTETVLGTEKGSVTDGPCQLLRRRL